MRTLEKTYSKSERIVAKAKFSCWVFWHEILLAVLLGGIIAVLWVFTDDINGFLGKTILSESVLKYAMIGVAAFVAVILIFEGIFRYEKEAIITDKKFVVRMLNKHLGVFEAQMPLEQIKGVKYNQKLVERLFGYGTVEIYTDAADPILIRGITKPNRFVQCLSRQVSRKESDMAHNFNLQLVPSGGRKHRTSSHI